MKLPAVIMVALFFSASATAAEDDAIQERIFNSYLEQAEQGDSNAQFIVASRYEIGKGTAKNIDKAYAWFEKAAKKGHPLAQRKLDERAEALAAAVPKPVHEAAPARNHAPTVATNHATNHKEQPVTRERVAKPETNTKPRETARTAPPPPTTPVVAKEAPAAAKTAEATVVARATPSELPAVSINIAPAVLGGKWSRNQRAAEILPSPLATCLQSNPSEIVCFSQELTRNVDSQGITYNVKATLSGIGNHDGRLGIHYVYNVIDVHNKPFAQPSSTQTDLADLKVANGWQEPGVRLECRLQDDRNLACTRNDRKLSYQFVRD